jgi:hypothetical protein
MVAGRAVNSRTEFPQLIQSIQGTVMAKESKTELELLDLVRAHVERLDPGSLDSAQFIKITHVANDPNRNWRVAPSGEASRYTIALDEAEAELTDLYDLA